MVVGTSELGCKYLLGESIAPFNGCQVIGRMPRSTYLMVMVLGEGRSRLRLPFAESPFLSFFEHL